MIMMPLLLLLPLVQTSLVQQYSADMISPSHLLVIILFFLILYILHRATKKPNYSKLPPSPPRLPIIGNLHQLGPLPHRSLCAFSDRLGPLMLLRLGDVPVLVASSADMAKQVLKTQDHVFASRPALKLPRQVLYNGRDIAFAPYGDYWRRVRKISVHHLLGTKRVNAYRSIREEETSHMLDEISHSSSSGPATVNVRRVLNSLAKDVIGRALFGKPTREQEWNDVSHVLIEDTSAMIGAFHVGDYFPWLGWLGAAGRLESRARKISEMADGILDEVVESHIARLNKDGGRGGDSSSWEEQQEEEDFVDVLLSLEKELNKDFYFDKENIKAILMDMFGAGSESISVVMEWVMAELARKPEAMNKLQQEVRRIAGSRALIREDDLSDMSYLKLVIKETLRLHPAIGPFLVPRESMTETEIQGYFIPKNTRVLVNLWAISRDPKVWVDPDEFKPERFEGSDVDFMGGYFEFIPFGAGRRGCPGIQFSVPIMELAVANLVNRFDWGLPEGEGPIDMAEAHGLTSRRRISLQLVATPRSIDCLS